MFGLEHGLLNAALIGGSDTTQAIPFLAKASGFHDACDGPAFSIQSALAQTGEPRKAVADGSERRCAFGCVAYRVCGADDPGGRWTWIGQWPR